MRKQENDFKVQQAEDSPGFLLWQVTTLWQRGIKKALAEIDITHPQFVLLASLLWLGKQQESVTQIDLSLHSKIDAMTVSAIIKILQRKELLTRQEHHADTRAKVLALTQNGIKITRRAIKLIEGFDDSFFAVLAGKTNDFNKSLLLLQAGRQEH